MSEPVKDSEEYEMDRFVLAGYYGGFSIQFLQECDYLFEHIERGKNKLLARKDTVKLKEELAELNQQLAIYPDSCKFLGERANVLMHLKRFQEAETDFKRCSVLDGREGWFAIFGLGMLYEVQGKN